MFNNLYLLTNYYSIETSLPEQSQQAKNNGQQSHRDLAAVVNVVLVLEVSVSLARLAAVSTNVDFLGTEIVDSVHRIRVTQGQNVTTVGLGAGCVFEPINPAEGVVEEAQTRKVSLVPVILERQKSSGKYADRVKKFFGSFHS